MIERLLDPDSTELPTCQCGSEMMLKTIERRTADSHLKIFACANCEREMRLMVWNTEPAAMSR